MRTILLICVLLVGMSAQASVEGKRVREGGEAGRFRYDPQTGTCEDGMGRTGLNRITLEELQRIKDGECADLKGIQLNGDDLSYPRLAGWNLRGANLSGAKLHFALLLEADLRGANLVDFEFGYAHVTGVVDRFTRFPGGELPRGRDCRVEDSRFDCWS